MYVILDGYLDENHYFLLVLRENIYIIIFHVVSESVVPAQSVSTCVLDPTGVLTPPDTSKHCLRLYHIVFLPLVSDSTTLITIMLTFTTLPLNLLHYL